MRPNLFVVLVALTLWPAVASADPSNWKRFEIPETAASVDVPADVFTKKSGKPETGFGAKLLTADGRANMTIQSMNNTAGETPSAFLARMNPPRDIVYKRVTPDFFVVSSFRKGMIWYDRCNFAGHIVSCVLINYPAAEKRQWDAIVTRISNSLSKS
ncbi:MAG TPA: hypothetical protein VJS63_10735 [Bradyrhizobium sp.]|nr:hypothetical protein [Bradyrhizobium sp.]